MRKLKYLTIYLLPLTVAISFTGEGLLTFLPLVVFFILIPLAELLLKPDARNLDEKERELAANDPFYDWLLYSMIPIQIGFLCWFLLSFQNAVTTLELVGRTISMGIMCGVIGINIGHELGHRTNRFEQFLGELLLLTSLENHFLPYHNRGHHNNVATHGDPATARKNEWLYIFWLRSHFGSYFQAWQIEFERMQIIGRPKFSIQNKMIVYTFVQVLLCTLILVTIGQLALLFFVIVAAGGILLLETVNYIEHYGLVREKRDNGTYDRVRRIHSWNSNHVFGRVVLFELSRHSDHHYKPDRPYQLLETHEESPIMPTGYPGMMLLALLPPLFFMVMNKKIEEN
jgi:alkane 1-monooxygenase